MTNHNVITQDPEETRKSILILCALMVVLVLLPFTSLAQDSFYAFLSGGSEVQSVLSMGRGDLTASYADGVLTIEGTFSGLSSPVNVDLGGGVHIHTGYAGRNGPVALSLTASLDADAHGGSFGAADNTFILDDDQKAALMERRMYVNIHTLGYPGGELRGQLLPAADAYYEVVLSGGNEIPAAMTSATGALVGELNGTVLTLSGSFAGMTSPAVRSPNSSGVHIHVGEPGGIGAVAFPMRPSYANDATSAHFAASANTFWLTPAQVDQLNKRRYYINVHSVQNKGGELRGQILPMSHQYFQAHFLGLHEVQPNMSGATGGAAGELLGNQLTVSGVFSMLNGDFDASIAGGAHLHIGGPDENGPIVVPLVTRLDIPTRGHFDPDDNVFMLTDEQVGDLLAGNHYFNIHTTAYPGGELRSQFKPADNNAPPPTVITTPAPGASVVAGGPANTFFVADWEPIVDPDGDEVVYIWELSKDDSFEGGEIRHAVNVGNKNQFSVTIEDLDALLAAANVPTGRTRVFYHRVISSDGSMAIPGPRAMVRITRDEVLDPLPTSRVQIVHASADPAAQEVDVYLDDLLVLNDFAYKTATPFLDIPSGTEIVVGVAGAMSTSSADAIATFAVTFEAGKSYHVVAAGVLDPTMFAPNPDGADIGFRFIATDGALEASPTTDAYTVRLVQTITDAPLVDFFWEGVEIENWSGMEFGTVTPYQLGVGSTANETVEIRTSDGKKPLIRQDGEPGGTAGVAFLSVPCGFLGLGYGSEAEFLNVFADGSVSSGTSTRTTAPVQVVHASPDPAAAVVDVYLDNLLALDDFAYRTGTPFVDLPANYPISVGIAPPTSFSKDDAIASFPVTFESGKSYHVVAAGVLDPSSIAGNPDGLETGFNLYASDDAMQDWNSTTAFGGRFFHAVPDVQRVDVVNTATETNERFRAWSDVGYGSFTEYGPFLPAPGGEIVVNLTPVDDIQTLLFSQLFDTAPSAGETVFVVATGLLNGTTVDPTTDIRIVSLLADGTTVDGRVVTGPSRSDEVPATFALHGNYPNPFNPSTAIVFDLPETAAVSVEVVDAIGRRVLVMPAREVERGSANTLTLDASGLVSGLYLYRLTAESRTSTWTESGRMLLVK